MQVGEARAQHLPVGHHSLHREVALHRDVAEAVNPGTPTGSSDAVVGRHPSSIKTAPKNVRINGNSSFAANPVGRAGSGSLQVQMGHVVVAAPSKAPSKVDAGAAVESAGDDFSSHHVVISSGALLSDLKQDTSHSQRDSSD